MPSILARAQRLKGKRVRITTVAGQKWEGTLAAIDVAPTFLLTRDDGQQLPPFSMTLVEDLEEIPETGGDG
jgi:hypothetical protein